MTDTERRTLIILAASGSAALMIAALAFQHIGGLPPCKLCIWQRWPHVIAIGLGVIGWFVPNRVLALAGAMAAAATAAVGLYHTGVERGFWEGPASCSSAGTSGVSAQELLARIQSAPLVRCDEVPWELFGLSMASWNAVIALFLMAVWLKAARA